MKDIILSEIEENITVNQDLIHTSIDSIEKAAALMISVIKAGNKILWCGNGGSAADAQHLATELMGGMGNYDRRPIPSIALTTDSSFLTAWSNDTDFESIFSRQIQGIGKENDLLIGISTSGISGKFSWGKLTGGVRSSTNPISVTISGKTVNSGLTTFPRIQRRNSGIRNTGALIDKSRA